MAFTISRLVEELQCTEEQASQILALVRGRLSPFEIAGTQRWHEQCYHPPDMHAPETIMHAIDQVLETYGTEAIFGGDSCTEPVAEYCNTGDTYAATILYDYVAGKYRLTSWGDWVEKYGDRYGVS